MPIIKGFSLGKVQKTEKEKGPLTVSRIPFPLFNFQLNNTFLFIASLHSLVLRCGSKRVLSAESVYNSNILTQFISSICQLKIFLLSVEGTPITYIKAK